MNRADDTSSHYRLRDPVKKTNLIFSSGAACPLDIGQADRRYAVFSRDPVLIMEQRDRERQRGRAREIARLPEHLWVGKLTLEPRDDREPIWNFLQAIRTARQLGLRVR